MYLRPWDIKFYFKNKTKGNLKQFLTWGKSFFLYVVPL